MQQSRRWWWSARFLVVVPACIVIAAIGRGLTDAGNDSLVGSLVTAGLVGVGIALLFVLAEQGRAARLRAISKRHPGAVFLRIRAAPTTVWVIRHLASVDRVSQPEVVTFDTSGMHVLAGSHGDHAILHVPWDRIGGFFHGAVEDDLGRRNSAVLVSIVTLGAPVVLPFAHLDDNVSPPGARAVDIVCARLEAMLADAQAPTQGRG